MAGMKVVVVTATGDLGACIVEEAALRDHLVTAVISHGSCALHHPNVRTITVSLYDAASLARVFLAQEAILYAFAAPASGAETRELLLKASVRAVAQAARTAGVRRIVAAADGLCRTDRGRCSASALREQALLEQLLSGEADLDWTLVCALSGLADIAGAVMDEMERGRTAGRRVVVGL